MPAAALRHERRVPQARLAAEDPGDVERRLDEDALVEVLVGAVVERHSADPRELLGAGRQLEPALHLVGARVRDARAQRLRAAGRSRGKSAVSACASAWIAFSAVPP